MSAKAELLKLLGAERFTMWFSKAVFEKNALVVKTSFQAQKIEERFASELRTAFGAPPEIRVDSLLVVANEKAAEKARKAEIVPIEKAKRFKTGFSARELILLNLPHSDPKESPVWTRKNGHLSLIVQGGYKMDPRTGKPEYVGIPYGATARLILFYFMTEATLTKERRIYLGNSFNAFLSSIGAAKDRRGKKTGAAAVIRQLERLVTASFMVQKTNEQEGISLFAGKSARFVDEFLLWFSKKEHDQTTLWSSYVELSQELFESLKKTPIPLDWDILLKLRKSPLAIDLYAWLTYEAARAQQTGRGRFIPWAALKEQMGAEYGTVKNFTQAARRELSKIKKLYLGLSLGNRRAGIEIKADSLPSIERKSLTENGPSQKD